QVVGDLRIGVGKRLVLAHHAAQLAHQVAETLLLRVVLEDQRGRVLRGLSQGQARRQREQEGKQQGPHPPSTSSSAGIRPVRRLSSVIGPTCFQRTTPSPSTRNVSGAP